MDPRFDPDLGAMFSDLSRRLDALERSFTIMTGPELAGGPTLMADANGLARPVIPLVPFKENDQFTMVNVGGTQLAWTLPFAFVSHPAIRVEARINTPVSTTIEVSLQLASPSGPVTQSSALTTTAGSFQTIRFSWDMTATAVMSAADVGTFANWTVSLIVERKTGASVGVIDKPHGFLGSIADLGADSTGVPEWVS